MANDDEIRQCNASSSSEFPDGGVNFWRQTRLLIQKNWKCKLRADKKKLAGEIFLPVLYLFLLSVLVKTQPNTKYPEQAGEDSKPKDVLSALGNANVINFVPNTTDAQTVCEAIVNISKPLRTSLSCNYYATLEDLEDDYRSGKSKIDMGVVFTEIDLTRHIFDYTIMTDPTNVAPPPQTSEKMTGGDTCRKNPLGAKDLEAPATCPVNGYFYSGFLGLQVLIDQTILQLSSNDSDTIPRVEMQNYPKLEYTGGMSGFLRAIIPLYSVIPMAQIINGLLILIVTEKEERIKDGFRMIGVSDAAYWMSWFTVYSFIIGILSVMFTLVMHTTNVLRNINILLLFLIFFTFGLSVITFAFALTPFFHRPKTAGVVGTLIMQFCGMLFMLQTFLDTSTDAFLVPLRLISSLAFTTALDEACAYEYSGGIAFSDLIPGRRGARVLYSLIFICFDIIFYAIIAVYLDNVIPNEYGARKHPLFCFMSSFWKRRDPGRYTRGSLVGDCPENGMKDDPNVEKVGPALRGKEAIRIRDIRKTYQSMFGSSKVEAVKGISLDIYDGQITAILGKNGAGKSTLFSIITGLVPPTSGECIVFGMNTSDPWDMDRLRKITGVCLQTNLLFDPLTVEEHLELYGKLRGLDSDTLSNEIESILEDLKLSEKRATRAANLSGGQKRKLSVGIALVGDPKIILLDEPSAGVDPVSRRHLWALLKRKKEGKIILLTTHFLDEADFLADRKAIIHDGVLKCHGSSLFLKNRFGVGYHLTIETAGCPDASECDAIIEKWSPEASQSRKIIGKEIKYCLPHSKVHVFADLFRDLEKLIENQNDSYKSCGVSMTTLEEVFLKISNDAWEEKDKPVLALPPENNEDPAISIGDECNLIPDLNEIKINFVESLWALCLLRIRRLIRSPQSLFFMLIMPSVLVAAGLALTKVQSSGGKRPLVSFDNPKTLYTNSRLAVNFTDELQDFLISQGFETIQYSGAYSELLDEKYSDPGTMAAVSVDPKSPQKINLRINGTFLHSPPLLINAISQFQLMKNSINVSTSTRPFAAKKSNFDASAFYAVFLIGPSFSFPAVGMVMELVRDREIHTRNHLRVNGVSFGLYFLSIIIVFGFLSSCITFMQIGLIYAFALSPFMNPYAMIVSTILLLLFIPSCLLFSTIFSYLFNRMESAQSVFSPISSWMGTLVGIAIIVMDGLLPSKTVLIAHGVFCALDVFYIPFAVFFWINKQYIICSLNESCDQLSFKNYLGPEIIIMIICLVVQLPVFAIFVVIADVLKNGGSPRAAIAALFTRKKVNLNSSRMNILNGEDPDGDNCTGTTDEDVLNERTRVANIFNGYDSDDKSVVAVKNLMKTYRPNKRISDCCRKGDQKGFEALKGINFAVEKGEVFGLLGHNGAGKTTAMKIIIAEESSDSGKVRLCGSDVESSYSDAFLKLGYCAQHDPLWENITLEEHLELYAIIRGIPKERRKRILDHFLVGLQIEEHSKKKAAKLSGGTKRKLSYGISVLGAPRIVLLDEPSTGMDPQSKRFLWNTILGSFKESRGAILTTHSMEEAEILCTRLAILAKGSLICIGSPQHLKSKYGTGYTLEIKLNTSEGHACASPEDRYAFVKEHFPDCKINEIFDDKAVFSLTTASVRSISKTFALLEDLKRQYDIEEYSFSQTTLEQIFLLFAKEENEEGDNDEDDVNTSPRIA